MKLVYKVVFFLFFLIIILAVIAYARGYRPDLSSGTLTPTGIIATSSSPRASKVYVNGDLKGVTDLNLTLPPGMYNVEVQRDGYHTWSKEIKLKGELVAVVDPVLFPINPSLTPLTNLGVIKAVAVDDTEKVLLFTETGDPLKDGVYLFESNRRPLSFLPPLTPIILKKDIPVSSEYSFSDSVVYFSPDYKQMVIQIKPALQTEPFSYLFSVDGENQTPLDTTQSIDNLLAAWDKERTQQNLKILSTFPKEMVKVASDSMQVISFSPDKKKILYKTERNIALPQFKKPVISSNQSPETRELKKGELYVYDKEEDRNYKIPYNIQYQGSILKKNTPTPARNISLIPSPTPLAAELTEIPPINWYYDSKHLIMSEKKIISAMDYDGTNRKTVYSGPFEEKFLVNTADGKIIVLSNLNPENNPYPDLYLVGIR